MVGGRLTKLLAIAVVMALGPGCGAAPSLGQGGSTATPATPSATTTPSSSPLASASPPPVNALVKCEDLPKQTVTSATFGFSISCPTNFTWETQNPPPGRLVLARTVDDKYLNGYPPGQVEISVAMNSGNNLRDWIASHVGPAYSEAATHFWDSTSNLTDSQIAGQPAVDFDYVFQGPEAPPIFHAAAFVLPKGSVFVIDWWASSSDYGPAIAAVAQSMIASIQVSAS